LSGRWFVVLKFALGNSTVIDGIYRPVLPYHRDPAICRVNEGKKIILGAHMSYQKEEANALLLTMSQMFSIFHPPFSISNA